MAKTPGGFRAALLIGWIALGAVGLLYARLKGIPSWAALPVLAAFLVEYPFYLVPAFPYIRERLAGPRLPVFAFAATVLPYLICSMGAITFQWSGLARLAALALALSLWYLVLPVTRVGDIAFLVLVASILLGKYFEPIYPKPYSGVSLVLLGHVSLIVVAVSTLMLQRRVAETGYGFVPNWNEWRTGALHFLGFAAVGLPFALAIKVIRYNRPAPLWAAAGIFLGTLWMVALSEEFFFQGVLRRWFEDWNWGRQMSLAAASVCFGSVHLWFGGHFPNWRLALVAALLGWFCGRARNQAGSIRAAMVTHALAVTTWRAFFT